MQNPPAHLLRSFNKYSPLKRYFKESWDSGQVVNLILGEK